ncbi:hypothetical protein NQ315_013972 [Exocentrus adspersus]|uniref:Uncharacterized protein n=1 Tax=Exocentrus adspersus TaxID=1586481 RepID=A0AAV8VRZ6_9CUCU|nr:hypothetical protein NQ315_013972 [Exocentrus adspersus]
MDVGFIVEFTGGSSLFDWFPFQLCDSSRRWFDAQMHLSVYMFEVRGNEKGGQELLRTPVLLNNSPIIRLSNIHEQCQDYYLSLIPNSIKPNNLAN